MRRTTGLNSKLWSGSRRAAGLLAAGRLPVRDPANFLQRRKRTRAVDTMALSGSICADAWRRQTKKNDANRAHQLLTVKDLELGASAVMSSCLPKPS